MGCAPLLHCLGRLSLPPFVGRENEYQPTGCVIITMAMVDVDDSCQFSADSSQVDWLGLRVGGHPALSLHSLDER